MLIMSFVMKKYLIRKIHLQYKRVHWISLVYANIEIFTEFIIYFVYIKICEILKQNIISGCYWYYFQEHK